tara:strand:- start:76 stop:222 length:147 start_codon:yes stop_codon:yes gene_type:complete
MNLLFLIIVILGFIFYLYRFLVKRSKRADYLRAGRKWESIVKELSERK